MIHECGKKLEIISKYVGRIAPTPSGLLHLGHAQTFWIAQERSKRLNGILILRVEDLDRPRCKAPFLTQMLDDLTNFGISWDLGPGKDHDFGPFLQSQRQNYYVDAWKVLYQKGLIYPSPHSRKDVEKCISAPHQNDEDFEQIFPTSLRTNQEDVPTGIESPTGINWRFRIPDNQSITFQDIRCGMKTYIAGVDFGDFIVWRADNVCAYELAVVVDDYLMGVTEVVRGEDLLLSTARQLLIYDALEFQPPKFLHLPLVKGPDGKRLAKRDAKTNSSNTLRALFDQGLTADMIRQTLFQVDEGIIHL